MYKAIIWDLDGTLLDTTSGVIYAVKYTIQQLDLPMPSEDILKTFVGPPMQLSFKKHFDMDEDEALKCANLFRKNYKEQSLFKAELYPNVLKVLEYLKECGYKVAVATNKSHDNAMEILAHFGVADYCNYMLGSDLEGKLKKKDIIEKCVEKLDVLNCETVYIGDSIFDYEGATANDIDFIGVTYGFGFVDDEQYSFQIIKKLEDLLNIL